MQIAEPSAAGDGFVQDRTARHLFDVLPEVADSHLLRNRDVAVIGRLLADDHAEECGLPGAVRPDETGPLARIELERCVDEDELPAVLLGNPAKTDHERAAERRRRRGDFSRQIRAPAMAGSVW